MIRRRKSGVRRLAATIEGALAALLAARWVAALIWRLRRAA